MPTEGKFEEILKKARAVAKVAAKPAASNAATAAANANTQAKKVTSASATKGQETIVESDPIFAPIIEAFNTSLGVIVDESVEPRDAKDKKKPAGPQTTNAVVDTSEVKGKKTTI